MPTNIPTYRRDPAKATFWLSVQPSMLTRAPLGGGYFEPPPSRFLAISSKPLQVSPPNLQYPLSQHFYTLC